MKKIVLLTLLVLCSSNVSAYSECTFDVGSVFIETLDGGTDSLNVQLLKPSGGTTTIFKNSGNTLSTQQLNRLYTLSLTAFTNVKKLVVRYPEDALDCTTLSAARNDFIGLTLSN